MNPNLKEKTNIKNRELTAGDTVIAWNEEAKNAKIGILNNLFKSSTGVMSYQVGDEWFLQAVRANDLEILQEILNKYKQR